MDGDCYAKGKYEVVVVKVEWVWVYGGDRCCLVYVRY